MQGPDVFTILLNWNSSVDTLACVKSVVAGSAGVKNEIVVVDNGSKKEPASYLEVDDPEFVLIKNSENIGFAAGNNVGIRYALNEGAKYIWILNNDTEVAPGSLAAMVSRLDSDNDLGIVGSVIRFMANKDKIQCIGGGVVNYFSGKSVHVVEDLSSRSNFYLTGCSILVRREVFESVGLLNEDYFFLWEDADFSNSVRKCGWGIAVESLSVVFHKASESIKKCSPLQTYYYNRGAVCFFINNCFFWPIPVTLGCAGRLVKRFLNRDWGGVIALMRGTFHGLFGKRGQL